MTDRTSACDGGHFKLTGLRKKFGLGTAQPRVAVLPQLFSNLPSWNAFVDLNSPMEIDNSSFELGRKTALIVEDFLRCRFVRQCRLARLGQHSRPIKQLVNFYSRSSSAL